MFFLGKCVRIEAKNHGCGQKQPEGTSSARFGLRTAAKCGELKRCADRVGSRTDNKDVKVVEGKFSNLNFLPSTKKTTEYSFELLLSICRWLIFFSQVLNFTSVDLNRFAKQAKLFLKKKPFFFKSDGRHAISRQEKHRLPKSTAGFPARKDGILHPLTVGLSWNSSPLPRICTDERAYVDITTKMPRIDRLPNLLSNGAPLAR